MPFESVRLVTASTVSLRGWTVRKCPPRRPSRTRKVLRKSSETIQKANSRPVYEFGPFRLDTAEQQLLREGKPVPLTPKVYEVLQLLVQNSGHMLGKEELLKGVWPDSFVEEGNLTRNISTLRAALGENSNDHHYIETVPKRGYRFIGDVRELQNGSSESLVVQNMGPHIVVEEKGGTGRETIEIPDEPAITQPEVRHSNWSRRYIFNKVRSPKLSPLLGLIAIVIAIASLVYYSFLINSSEAIESLAVVPVDNGNSDDDTRYLSEGISESIINNLSQLHNLRIIALNSVLYKRKLQDPQAVGRELNVQAVLIVRPTLRGDNLSISVELVDVRDNRHLWGDQYNRKLTDIAAMPEDISRDISEKLRPKMSGEDTMQITKPYTENAEAYKNYLQGVFYTHKMTPVAVKRAIEYYEEAIKLDPRYALAYVGLARAYYTPRQNFVQISEEARQQTLSALQKALELDGNLAEAHALLGAIRQDQEDWPGAEKELKRAHDLNPNAWGVRWYYVKYLSATGRNDEAITEAKQLVQNDPLSPNSVATLGWSYLYARYYDLAIQSYRRVVEVEPDHAPFHTNLARAYVQKGMYEEAIAEFQKAMTLNSDPPGRRAAFAYTYAISGKKAEAQKMLDELKERAKHEVVAPVNFAIVYAGLGDKDRAFEWLEKYYKDRSGPPYLAIDLMLDSLRSDPRFADLARRKGLAL